MIVARSSRVKEVTLNIYRRAATVMALLILSLAVPGLSTGQSDQDSGRGTTQIDSGTPGVHDFDFLVGRWRVHHRTLKERLANSHEWIEFEGTLVNQPLMGATAMSTIPYSRSRALPFVVSLCDPLTRRRSSGQSGGSTAGRHWDLWTRL